MTIKKIFLLAAVFAAALLALSSGASAADPPPVGAGLVIDNTNTLMPGKSVFLQTRTNGNVSNGVIPISLTLQSTVPSDIVTAKGFKEAPFHLLLVFTDPDGKGVRSKEFGNTPWADPPPPIAIPINGELVQAEPVEILPTGWRITVRIPDANAFYDLIKPGRYAVQAVIPLRTYHPLEILTSNGESFARLDAPVWQGSILSNVEYFTLTADLDGDGYYAPEACARQMINGINTLICDGNAKKVDCNDNDPTIHPGAAEPIPWDGIDHDCDPATPGVPATPSGKILIQAVKHVVGSGHHPSCGKEPIPYLPVKVVEKKHDSCAGGYGESWRAFTSIWANCPAVATGVTDLQGNVSFTVPEGRYMVVGFYDPDPSRTTDDVYVGKSVGEVKVNRTVRKKLHVLVTAGGKSLPGKSQEREETELEVIEPEYLDWTDLQALYPVIFEGEGELNASSSIHVPAGFDVDYPELSAEGSQATRAIQFTIKASSTAKGTGSDQKEIPLEHKFKHRKKPGIIKSTVDKHD